MWKQIEIVAESRKEYFHSFGVYEIAVVNAKGKPIPIARLAGVDKSGLLYIGRSGFRNQKTKRTITKRIKEFLNGPHSGGETYDIAFKVLSKTQKFSKHRLKVRASILPDRQIIPKETKLLKKYFLKYGELPPLNSSIPCKVRERR